MSFFDDASLVLLTSGAAGKDGKAYSMKPTDGSGDFTFSRGSNLTATRVDSNGLIEKGRENLVYNSGWEGAGLDTNPTNWTKFLSGTGTFNTTATDGQIRFQTADESSRAFIYTNSIATNGIVVVSAYVDEVSTTIALSNLITRSANATQLYAYEDGVEIDYNDNVQAGKRYSVVFDKTASTTFRFGVGASGGALGDVVLSKPQVEVGLAATEWILSNVGETGKAGLLENEPRFDYSGGATCPSLLLEPQRTNLVTHSEYFNIWQNSGTQTIVANASTSPQGLQNASSIQIDSGYIYEQVSGLSISIGDKYIWSCYVNSSSQKLTFGGGTTSGTDVYSSEDVGSGWYRQILTRTFTSSGGAIQPMFNVAQTGTDLFYIWGAQLEEGSYPTSYMPNHSGGSVTRNGDVCEGAGTSSTFNDSEGVLYAEIAYIADDQTSKVISLSDGTFDERVVITSRNGVSNEIRVFVKSGGSFSATIDATLSDITDFNKIAYRYKSGETKLFINGSLISTSTDTFSIRGLNALRFASGTSTASPFYGNAKQVIVFNTALSDSQLIALTS